MKRLLLSLIATATMLAAAAETFESDGIWYSTNDDNKTVSITWPQNGEPYSGKITIVPEVTHEGKTYAVNSAGLGCFYPSQISEFTIAAGFPEKSVPNLWINNIKTLTKVNIGSYGISPRNSRLVNLAGSTNAVDVDIRESDGKTLITIKKFEIYDIGGTKLTPCLINPYQQSDSRIYTPDANGVITIEGTESNKSNLFAFDVVPFSSGGVYVIYFRAFNPTDNTVANIYITPNMYKTGEYVTCDGLRYSLRNGKAYVYAPAEGTTYTGDIVIPSTITADGTQYTVAGIAKDAFSNSEITSVKLNPECEVGSDVFNNCPKLVYADMSACRILPSASTFFSNCPVLKRIDGPRAVGEYSSFAYKCPALETITVAEGSKFKTDKFYPVTSDCPAMYTSDIVDVTEQTVTLRVTPGLGGGVCTTDGSPLPICIQVGIPGTNVYADADGLYTFSRDLMLNKTGMFISKIYVCYDRRTDSYLEVPADGDYYFGSIEVTEEDLANFSGISDIAAPDAAAPVEYYDLQGRRVASPSQPGLYLRRQGTRSEKVLIRHSR